MSVNFNLLSSTNINKEFNSAYAKIKHNSDNYSKDTFTPSFKANPVIKQTAKAAPKVALTLTGALGAIGLTGLATRMQAVSYKNELKATLNTHIAEIENKRNSEVNVRNEFLKYSFYTEEEHNLVMELNKKLDKILDAQTEAIKTLKAYIEEKSAKELYAEKENIDKKMQDLNVVLATHNEQYEQTSAECKQIEKARYEEYISKKKKINEADELADEYIKLFDAPSNIHKEEIVSLNEEIRKIEDTVSELENKRIKKSKAIDDVQKKIETLSIEIERRKAAKSEISPETTKLMTTLESNHASFSTESNELSKEIEKNNEKKNEIEQKIELLQDDDKDVYLDTDIKKQLDFLNSKMNNLQNEVGELKEQYIEKNNRIWETEISIQALNEKEKRISNGILQDEEKKFHLALIEKELNNYYIKLQSLRTEMEELSNKLNACEKQEALIKQLKQSLIADAELTAEADEKRKETLKKEISDIVGFDYTMHPKILKHITGIDFNKKDKSNYHNAEVCDIPSWITTSEGEQPYSKFAKIKYGYSYDETVFIPGGKDRDFEEVVTKYHEWDSAKYLI